MNYKYFLPELNADQDTVVKFFVVFSRFEFALKQADYLKKGIDGRRAEPNWPEFETKYKDEFDPEKESELREACDYLLKKPPKKQVVVNDKLDFKVDEEKLKEKSPFEKIGDAIRTVRNNLFHGGKCGPIEEPARNRLLLKHCTLLLEEMLELDPRVKKKFNQTNRK